MKINSLLCESLKVNSALAIYFGNFRKFIVFTLHKTTYLLLSSIVVCFRMQEAEYAKDVIFFKFVKCILI